MAKKKPIKPVPDHRVVDHFDAPSFISHINENPDDHTSRLVYADFLDENGYPQHAEAVRADAHHQKSPETGRLVRLAGITPAKPKIDKISVMGRRWFDRKYGNTYHTSEIHINGEPTHKTDVEYGYGQQYLHTAYEWLRESGYLPEGMDYSHFYHGAYADRRPFVFEQDSEDVKRKSDL